MCLFFLFIRIQCRVPSVFCRLTSHRGGTSPTPRWAWRHQYPGSLHFCCFSFGLIWAKMFCLFFFVLYYTLMDSHLLVNQVPGVWNSLSAPAAHGVYSCDVTVTTAQLVTAEWKEVSCIYFRGHACCDGIGLPILCILNWQNIFKKLVMYPSVIIQM